MNRTGYTGNIKNYQIKRGSEMQTGEILMLTGLAILLTDATPHKGDKYMDSDYIIGLSLLTGDNINLPLRKSNGELKEYTVANTIELQRSR